MEKNDIIAHKVLRYINTTLNICLPAAYCREQDLQKGDHVVMIREGDELRLRFIRTRLAEQEQGAAAQVPPE
jgi:hypothetical protein